MYKQGGQFLPEIAGQQTEGGPWAPEKKQESRHPRGEWASELRRAVLQGQPPRATPTEVHYSGIDTIFFVR